MEKLQKPIDSVHIGFCWESQKERDHYENLDVGGG
jgi:hypothetical protein